MAVNHKSGRVVVDLDPELKRALYAALAADGLSLKQWMARRVTDYIAVRSSLGLVVAESPASSYRQE